MNAQEALREYEQSITGFYISNPDQFRENIDILDQAKGDPMVLICDLMARVYSYRKAAAEWEDRGDHISKRVRRAQDVWHKIVHDKKLSGRSALKEIKRIGVLADEHPIFPPERPTKAEIDRFLRNLFDGKLPRKAKLLKDSI